jgi:hypothetical protein
MDGMDAPVEPSAKSVRQRIVKRLTTSSKAREFEQSGDVVSIAASLFRNLPPQSNRWTYDEWAGIAHLLGQALIESTRLELGHESRASPAKPGSKSKGANGSRPPPASRTGKKAGKSRKVHASPSKKIKPPVARKIASKSKTAKRSNGRG